MLLNRHFLSTALIISLYKMPQAAGFKHKIIIQSATEVQDAYGQPVETFATYATRSAKIINKPASEKFTGYQEVNAYPIQFVVRYDSLTKNITEKMRVSFNSNIYDIESVIDPYEMHKEIHIHGVNRGA